MAMRNRKPPFEITNAILDEIAEIAELVGHMNATLGLSTNPTLRRTNRIRTIYSSLAIEQNTLSLDQVTAVLNGKRVIAPPRDIAEVKNAYEIYEMMDSLMGYEIGMLRPHLEKILGELPADSLYRDRANMILHQIREVQPLCGAWLAEQSLYHEFVGNL